MRIFAVIFLSLGLLIPVQSLWARTLPNDGLFINQWYLRQIGAEEAWDVSVGSSDVIIAVLDSGVEIDHEDLVGNIYTNPGEIAGDSIDNDNNGFIDDMHGWDFYDRDSNPSPEMEGDAQAVGLHHGTVVAGLLGADGNNSIGVTGLNWDVSILPIRVLDSNGDGTFNTIIEGIDYAVMMGADVVNLSFVGEVDSLELRQALVRAHDAGVIVVAALGNVEGGRDVDVDPLYPACSLWDDVRNIVIGVAATDERDERATFSNYGKNCSDLAAPGDNIFTTQVSDVGLSAYGGGWNGTSLAAPLVSGAAGLLRAAYNSITPDQVIQSLQLSVDPVVGMNPKGQTGTLGAGRLNVGRAMTVAASLIEEQGEEPVETVTESDPDLVPELATIVPVTTPLIVGGSAGEPGRVETTLDSSGSSSTWFPYGESFRGGVRVAVGQLDSDPGFEIVTAPGPGGGPHIKVFDEQGNLENEFFAYRKDFRGGVSVAVADVDGDGIGEIITAPGVGEDPVVKFHRKAGGVMNKILLKTDGSTPLHISTGDLDGDGAEDVVVSSGEGVESRVWVYRLYGTQLTSFLSYSPDMKGEVHTGVWVDEDGNRLVVTRTNPDVDPHVRFFNYIGAFVGQFDSGANSGDNGDVTVWHMNDSGTPVVAVSRTDNSGKPDVVLYNRDGSLSPVQLVLEHEYERTINLSQ